MATQVGTPIQTSFRVLDYANVPQTGKTSADFTVLRAIHLADDVTAAVTLQERGNGYYDLTFTPSSAGWWSVEAVYESGGVHREFSDEFDVADAAGSTVSPTLASILGATRLNLRQEIGRRLGDLVVLHATADGSDSSFVDNQRLTAPANVYSGRTLLFIDGTPANVGLSRYVTGSSDEQDSVNFTPTAPAITTAGDTAELWSVRNTGWQPWDVNDTINDVIRSARVGFWIPQTIALVDVFDPVTSTLTIPSTFNRIALVEYQDTMGYWQPIRPALSVNGPGYTVRRGQGMITINGTARTTMTGMAVRLTGYGDLAELVNDTDRTPLNAEWLAKEAVARLLYAASDRRPDNQAKYMLAKREADSLRSLAQGRPASNTVLV